MYPSRYSNVYHIPTIESILELEGAGGEDGTFTVWIYSCMRLFVDASVFESRNSGVSFRGF